MILYFYDEEGFFTSTYIVKDDEDITKYRNCTTEILENGFYKPKFDGKKWIEGMENSEILKNNLQETSDDVDIPSLLLNIFKFIKGGDIMGWFFNNCLIWWQLGKVNEAYIKNAFDLGLLNEVQKNLILSTPKGEN